jgi:hypothetical protein
LKGVLITLTGRQALVDAYIKMWQQYEYSIEEIQIKEDITSRTALCEAVFHKDDTATRLYPYVFECDQHGKIVSIKVEGQQPVANLSVIPTSTPSYDDDEE